MTKAQTILIVDDEARNIELLQAILEPGHFELLAAANGSEALAILETREVDLVLLDVMMPLVDGFEVTRRIRAGEKTQGLPVILVTALHEVSERIKGIEAGCDEFITKPFDRHEVAARVKTLLRLNRYRTQIDEKEKFERVINRMNDGLLVCDAGLRIVRYNQKARELLGFDDPAPGWLERLGRDFRIAHYGQLEHDLAVVDLDFDMERPQTHTAKPLILSFSSSLVRDADGALASVVILLHDVTAQRKEQFRKESFLSLMSDKLRMPLAVSLERLGTLRESSGLVSDQAFKQSIESTVDLATDFLAMMDKIFDFLTVHAPVPGEDGSDAAGLDRAQVEALAVSIMNRPGPKKIEYEFDLPLDLDLSISEKHMEILMKNLIENAVKFNDHYAAKIAISAVREGGLVRFTVADNGQGIPGEERQSVFDAFYQIDKPGIEDAKGLGLGLAIVKKIVEAGKGEVKVEAPPKGGTAISFTLPQAAEADAPRSAETLAVSR
ncbi:MAG TPA: response regulator [bacterium]|jgi:two-component system cell cycle response regulator|nr:response regulator [bacterium]